MQDSTPKPRTRKPGNSPKKPYPDFPLTPHASGKWQKKIRGKVYYFGNWARRDNGKLVRVEGDGWKEAYELYKAQADDLHAGRTPRIKADELTVKELGDRFLTAKFRKMQSGELSPHTFQEYRQAAELLAAKFGKTRLVDDLAADDFEKLRADMAVTWGPLRLGKFIGIIRSIFLYAVDNKLIDRPVTFGSEFKKPKKSVVQKLKNQGGKKLFTSQEIRDLLNGKTVESNAGESVEVPTATPQMRAMILLGINAGLGNTDVGNLQKANLDLKAGWLDYPRVKTGLPRRVPLWEETVQALKESIAIRPTPKMPDEDAGCVFLNRRGTRFTQNTDRHHCDYVSTAFGKRLRSMKINGRKGLNFYSLRHTFATIGLQTGDRDAVKTLMGHSFSDMLAGYDEMGPSDDRLQAVVAHVRTWLFGSEGGAK